MTLDKTLMPVPDGQTAVFERSWPLRVGDIDRSGRLPLDAVARLIQDIGQDHVHALRFDKTHPVGVVRRTIIDLIRPIEFQDTLRLRRGARAPPAGGAKSACASTAAKEG
jgi:acyl-ACP thioesterase